MTGRNRFAPLRLGYRSPGPLISDALPTGLLATGCSLSMGAPLSTGPLSWGPMFSKPPTPACDCVSDSVSGSVLSAWRQVSLGLLGASLGMSSSCIQGIQMHETYLKPPACNGSSNASLP